jgi:hypothetical protein
MRPQKKPRPVRTDRGFLIDAWQRLLSTGAVSAKRKKRLCEADKRVTWSLPGCGHKKNPDLFAQIGVS